MPITPEDARLKPKGDLATVRTDAVVKQAAPEVPEKLAYDDHTLADSIGAQKEVAFYGAVASTWIATRMELDKTLLTLSAAGLGLFLTLLTTVGVRSPAEIVFYGVGTLGFSSAIGLALRIFYRNADFLQTLTGARHTEGDKTLARLDRWLWVSFVVGALSAIAAGASAANFKYRENQKQPPSGVKMSDGNPKAGVPNSTERTLQESVNGLQMIRPSDGGTPLSVDGLQKLRPNPSPATTSPPDKASEAAITKPTPKKD